MSREIPSRSDTAKAVLTALADIPDPEWCFRYLGYSKSLSTGIDRAYVAAHPDRRNRPQYRNIERALAALIEAREVEVRVAGSGIAHGEKLYRLTPSGRAAATQVVVKK